MGDGRTTPMSGGVVGLWWALSAMIAAPVAAAPLSPGIFFVRAGTLVLPGVASGAYFPGPVVEIGMLRRDPNGWFGGVSTMSTPTLPYEVVAVVGIGGFSWVGRRGVEARLEFQGTGFVLAGATDVGLLVGPSTALLLGASKPPGPGSVGLGAYVPIRARLTTVGGTQAALDFGFTFDVPFTRWPRRPGGLQSGPLPDFDFEPPFPEKGF